MTGQRFGRLTVASFIGRAYGASRWFCRCDCGSETTVAAGHLRNGKIKSCGCLRRETSALHLRTLKTTHGKSQEPWFTTWAGMMYRCSASNGKRFHRYGGRGITVCARWQSDPSAFHADMGDPPPGMSLDRINNDLGYSPENCRWATDRQQNNNRASTREISFGDQSMSAAEWARRVGVAKATMYWRLKNWPLERALTAAPTK